MIEVNLLPLELRKKKKISLEQFFKRKSLFVVLGSLVLFHLFLYTVTLIKTRELNKLKSSWQGLSSKKMQIDRLRAQASMASNNVPLLEQLIGHRVLWSEKLNKISDLTNKGIWLNEISVTREEVKSSGEFSRALTIRGSAASRTKDEPALIGRFMQDLKNNSYFSADFTEIELGPIKKRQISQTEVMDFTLICRFKPEKIQGRFE